jgi:hypothetical protein
MKRRCGLFPAALFLLISSLYAAEHPYVTGTIVDVQEKVHTRVLYYVVDTPITRDDPYFEVQIQIRDTVYTGEYTPRHAVDHPPTAWKFGSEVQLRLEKHTMSLKRPDGEEMEFMVTRHATAPPFTEAPQPTPSRK